MKQRMARLGQIKGLSRGKRFQLICSFQRLAGAIGGVFLMVCGGCQPVLTLRSQSMFNNIEVARIPDRQGVVLRQELLSCLRTYAIEKAPSGNSSTILSMTGRKPLYELSVSLKTTETPLFVGMDAQRKISLTRVQASFHLRDNISKRVLCRGVASTVYAKRLTSAYYSRTTMDETGQDAAMRYLARALIHKIACAWGAPENFCHAPLGQTFP